MTAAAKRAHKHPARKIAETLAASLIGVSSEDFAVIAVRCGGRYQVVAAQPLKGKRISIETSWEGARLGRDGHTPISGHRKFTLEGEFKDVMYHGGPA